MSETSRKNKTEDAQNIDAAVKPAPGRLHRTNPQDEMEGPNFFICTKC